MNAELFAPHPTKGEQAKQRLLLAALEKIGEKGYENASVREIADAAGQNIAAISYYFGSKEKLYAAVVDGIVNYLRAAFSEVATEARERLDDGSLDPQKAAELLKRILRIFLVEHIERSEIAKLRNVMMREQAAPTCAFDHLYDKGIKPLHELFTRTLAVASGDDPESPQAIIRAHTLLGQVIGFTVARCTIIRRLGIEKLEKQHADMIAGMLDQNVEAICAGLLKNGTSK
jgi:AcrR family transcriptional regulator